MATPYRISSAHLDHINFQSSDSRKLAAFYAETMQMAIRQCDEYSICSGPARKLVFSQGNPGTIGYSAFRFTSLESFADFRAHLAEQEIEVVASPSPLFSEDAIALEDPDGFLTVYDTNYAAGIDLPEHPHAAVGRLQHYAIATDEPEPALTFYVQKLGFVVSDRVIDDDGKLRAAFLRTDQEHHTLAIFLADRKRPDHHCYEAGDWNLIRDWADHLSNCGVPLQWGPGRHGPGHNLFFMIHDPDGNWVEISAELDVLADGQPAGEWPHSEKTLNSWGQAFLRS